MTNTDSPAISNLSAADPDEFLEALRALDERGGMSGHVTSGAWGKIFRYMAEQGAVERELDGNVVIWRITEHGRDILFRVDCAAREAAWDELRYRLGL